MKLKSLLIIICAMFSMSTFEANAEGNQPDNNVVIVKSPLVKRTPKRQQPIVLSYDHKTGILETGNEDGFIMGWDLEKVK